MDKCFKNKARMKNDRRRTKRGRERKTEEDRKEDRKRIKGKRPMDVMQGQKDSHIHRRLLFLRSCQNESVCLSDSVSLSSLSFHDIVINDG